MLRRILCAALFVASAAATDSRASCVEVVEVGGTPLFGQPVEEQRLLPRVTGPHPAIEPACGEVGDRSTSTLRLAEIPPEIAVLSRDRRTVYLAEGSLTQLADHPLNPAVTGLRRLTRAPGCRPNRRPLRARVVELLGSGFTADVGESGADIRVDAQTRITNREPYTPIRPGQKLRLRTSTCDGRRVADRIAFAGPVPTAAESGTDGAGIDGEDGVLSPYVIPSVLVGAALIFVVGVGAALLIPTGRRRRPR